MSRPDVSVLMTVYNGLKNYPSAFLDRAIKSVLDEQPGVTVELLIADDGSDDGTAVVLTKLAQDDERVRVKFHTTRRGVAAGFNTAAAMATGRYVILLSTRGWYERGALADMVKALDEHPEAGFVYGATQYHGVQHQRHTPPPFNAADFNRSFISLYGYLYRAEALQAGCQYENYLRKDGVNIDVCDYDFVMQLIHRMGWSGVVIDRLALNYHYSGAGQMTAKVHEHQAEIDAIFHQRWLEDKTRVGWLADEGDYKGGAELESDFLQRAAPSWAEVVRIPAGAKPPECDVYVVHNCVQYDRWLKWDLAGKPVIKRVHDTWPDGDPFLRAWLLNEAHTVILSSPKHREVFRWHIGAPVVYLPSPTAPAPALNGTARKGAVSINRWWPGKGVAALKQWAIDNGKTVDVYGFGPQIEEITHPLVFKGALRPSQVAEVLSHYEQFVFLPDGFEPFSRVVVEAWKAGCELVINGNVGARHWLETDPAALDDQGERFWSIVGEAVGRRE